MEFSEYFPIWDKLTPAQQQTLAGAAALRSVPGGTVLHNGSADCIGFLLEYHVVPDYRGKCDFRIERKRCNGSQSGCGKNSGFHYVSCC